MAGIFIPLNESYFFPSYRKNLIQNHQRMTFIENIPSFECQTLGKILNWIGLKFNGMIGVCYNYECYCFSILRVSVGARCVNKPQNINVSTDGIQAYEWVMSLCMCFSLPNNYYVLLKYVWLLNKLEDSLFYLSLFQLRFSIVPVFLFLLFLFDSAVINTANGTWLNTYFHLLPLDLRQDTDEM